MADAVTPSFAATVSGRVQGVGYRAWARFEARRLGLRGYVINEPDGSVSVVARGGREALERLIGRLRAGPPGASVAAVSVRWNPGDELTRTLPSDFEVRYRPGPG